MTTRALVLSCALVFTLGANISPAAPALNYSVLDKSVPGAGGNSPEDDARPGEYYFMRGVEAFRANEFDHAIKMYEAAASWGYKNAQYNLAVMYARGQGVAEDLPRAMAWIALAAERNDKQYVNAREMIYATLTKEQWDHANEIWRELRKEYGDTVALERAKARWAEVRQGMTGSHVGSIGHLEVGTPAGAPSAASVSALSDKPEHQPGGGRSAATGKGTIYAGPVPNPGGVTAADIAGANTVDGSEAYGNLRATDNPYDPRFSPRIGTATVGDPISARQAEQEKKADADKAQQSE